MEKPYSLLVLGASYGSLFAARALAAGQSVALVGRENEVELIKLDGIRVTIPPKKGRCQFQLNSHDLRGRLDASTPEAIRPEDHDLVVLAMQEPHYQEKRVHWLMDRIASSSRPCLSIMNIAPPPFLNRIAALSGMDSTKCYGSTDVWQKIDPRLFTLCSPDPQAMRPADGPLNRLAVGLASNFRASAFRDTASNKVLLSLAASMNNARIQSGNRMSSVPVKLRIHASDFVPLSKWSMLIAGNYRCITPRGIRSICEAVQEQNSEPQKIFEWTNDLLRALGASDSDLVPFTQYARVARKLRGPSSIARALYAGSTSVERVDRLIQMIANRLNIDSAPIDPTVALVDTILERNRNKTTRTV